MNNLIQVHLDLISAVVYIAQCHERQDRGIKVDCDNCKYGKLLKNLRTIDDDGQIYVENSICAYIADLTSAIKRSEARKEKLVRLKELNITAKEVLKKQMVVLRGSLNRVSEDKFDETH